MASRVWKRLCPALLQMLSAIVAGQEDLVENFYVLRAFIIFLWKILLSSENVIQICILNDYLEVPTKKKNIYTVLPLDQFRS